MKKTILILFIIFIGTLQVLAENSAIQTFQCSYISSGTNLHFTLAPITIKSDEFLYVNNKIVGKVVGYDKKTNKISAELSGGSTWSIETNRMLSVYTKPLGNDTIYNFGSCIAK